MKKFMKILKWLVFSILAVVILLRLTNNGHLIKGIWVVYMHGHTTAAIDDGLYFDIRPIAIDSGNTKPWLMHQDYNKIALSDALKNKLETSNSVAFLVARGDSIIREDYWDGYSETSLSNSFSATKAITTLLVQRAIQDGYLKGWNQKVIDIFPDLKGEFAEELEIQHLAAMTSGMHWEEDYKNPFGITAKAYYSDNVWEVIKALPFDIKPGTEFEYQSGSTMLLGMILIKATGLHLSDYASKVLWKPMQAEQTASWHLDKAMGTELAYCCFNSNARDFARFGKLNNHAGNWDGNQIIDSSFYDLAAVSGAAPYYGMGFWITDKYDTQVFYHSGLLGQLIISIPEYNLVVVRLGKSKGPNADDKHSQLFHEIVEDVLNTYGISHPTDSNLNQEITQTLKDEST
jgi:CubicO group peptidase (beta-lactamase class C family)